MAFITALISGMNLSNTNCASQNEFFLKLYTIHLELENYKSCNSLKFV